MKHRLLACLVALSVGGWTGTIAAAAENTPRPDVSVGTGKKSFDGFAESLEDTERAQTPDRPAPAAPDPNKYLPLPECAAANMLDGMSALMPGQPAPEACEDSTVCALQGGGQATEVFRLRPGDSAYESLGLRCPNGRAASPAAVGERLRSPFAAMVPKQRPGVQPKGRALVHVPTIFYAGQPATMNRTVRVQGVNVRIHATATFSWQFDRGVRKTFSEPGAPYPNMDVTHTYDRTGKRRVRLTTTWRGQYQIGNGLLRPIPGTVQQLSSPMSITIVESRPQLVAPDD